jgi:cytochrome d ubiquinol oxidase subunit II
VLGGGGMMAAFPLAYAVLMPALYTPMTVMLLGLVFRGVAFEFRWRTSQTGKNRWDIAFAGGSLLATLAQGIALGAMCRAEIEGRAYAGGWWDWLTPFSLLTGAALVQGYGLLGATWLVWKTEGRAMPIISAGFAVRDDGAIGAVSIATPFHISIPSAGFPGRVSSDGAGAIAVRRLLLLRSLARNGITSSS